MKFIGYALIIFTVSVSQASSMKCSDPQLKKYVEMDYKAFDQSPSDGGWRILQGKGKDLQIAEIIDGYLKCRPGITKDQKATLFFHAGQIYGDLGMSSQAVERMKQAYSKDMDKKYHWNSYVDGSIAFLERDLARLKSARDKVLAVEEDHPYVETLNDLIRCYYRPYKEFDQCRNEKTSQQKLAPAAVQ